MLWVFFLSSSSWQNNFNLKYIKKEFRAISIVLITSLIWLLQMLSSGEIFPSDVGKRKENVSKNRYKTILPCKRRITLINFKVSHSILHKPFVNKMFFLVSENGKHFIYSVNYITSFHFRWSFKSDSTRW